jgi:deoxyribose-phosphate aldolase
MHNPRNIAGLIDHTLLRPDAAEADIIKLCDEAKENGFFSVCIHPSFIETARDALSGTDVRISTVIGFPLGMTLSKVKAFEAVESLSSGADELDIVMNIGLAKSGRWGDLEKDISTTISAAPEALHKIIIEACYLTDEEKRSACTAVINAGAGFIKTSTGFGPSGASIEDVRLIRSITKGKIGIKAAGGIKSLAELLDLVDAGASRIGTSSGVPIMKELEKLDNSGHKAI